MQFPEPAGHWLHFGGCRQWWACGQSAWQNTLLAPRRLQFLAFQFSRVVKYFDFSNLPEQFGLSDVVTGKTILLVLSLWETDTGSGRGTWFGGQWLWETKEEQAELGREDLGNGSDKFFNQHSVQGRGFPLEES